MPVFEKRIRASVGRGGTNAAPDRLTVMYLLNQVPFGDGGPSGFLRTTTPSGELAFQIEHFQRVQFGGGDGRVDVEGRTLRLLREFDPDPEGPATVPTTSSGKKSSGRKKGG